MFGGLLIVSCVVLYLFAHASLVFGQLAIVGVCKVTLVDKQGPGIDWGGFF